MQLELDFCADTVEWCPVQKFCNFLAVGTYEVLDSNGSNITRTGRLYFIKFENDQLDIAYKRDANAILDSKWCCQDTSFTENCFLGHVDAMGNFIVDKLVDSGSLEPISTVNISSELNGNISSELNGNLSNVLGLSLDWEPQFFKANKRALVSYSSGHVAVFQLQGTGDFQLAARPWQAHSYEAWCAAFDAHNSDIVYSGGDDLAFGIWDLRAAQPSTVFLDSKAPNHMAGVTSFLSHPVKPNVLYSGSYDEFLRQWDTRFLKKPVVQSKVNVGGGVWRIKYKKSSDNADLLLLAGMYNGFSVYEHTGSNFKLLHTDAQGKENSSIAYGASWQQCVNSKVAATCSFYDKMLRVWTL